MQGEDDSWLKHRDIAAETYTEANYSSPLQSFVMYQSHKLAEKTFDEKLHFDRVLEVGAGTCEHLVFVKHTFGEYIMTDLDQKALDVAKEKLGDRTAHSVKFEKQNATDLDYPDDSFDRVIGVHILEHLYQPHLAIKEWYRVLRDGGVMTILIPTDPGVAWRLCRYLGPRRRALKAGIPYDYIMAREHVNPCNNLITFIKYYFPEGKGTWWPLPIALVDVNLFYAFNIKVNKTK
ncbi:class I SAM-dependent methyltransferase [bacterium]|nr:class I SAM-dependent methyltransferase [bacterium]